MKLHRPIFGALSIAILCLLFGLDAWATNPPATPTAAQSTSSSRSESHAKASSHSTSHAVGVGGSGGNGGNAQGGAGGNGGTSNASQTQSANNAGNSQATTIATVNEDRLQAPGVFAPAVYASGPCAYGWSAGLSIPGGGISGGKSKADASCDRRELARVMTPLNAALALKILCADPIAAAVATEADCSPPASLQLHGTSSPSPASDIPPTRAEVDEKIDRVFRKTVSK